MNHAQIDHLLQATATRSESLPGISRARESAPPFDHHFRDASAASTSAAQAPVKSTPTAQSSSGSAAAAAPNSSASNSKSDERTAQAPPSEASATSPSAVTPVGETASKESVKEPPTEPTSELDENVEVAALLAAEQAAKTSLKDTPAAEHKLQTTGRTPEDDSAKVVADPDARSAKPKAQPTPTARTAADDVPVTSGDKAVVVNAAAVKPQAALDTAVTKAKTDAADDVTEPAATIAKPTDADPQLEPQPERSEHRNGKAEVVPVAQTPADQANTHPAAQASADATHANPAAKLATAVAPVASTKSTPAVERSESSTKFNKKTDARTDVAPRDAANAPMEQPAMVPRALETATGTAVAAANVPQGVAADAAATASSPTAKSSGGGTEARPGLLSSLQRLERSAASAPRGAHRAGQSESAPHVDPVRFVSRVARAVQTAQERGTPLQLRLSPPELGAMRIELSVHQGTLTATIETDNTSAKQILLDNLPQLRERLADQNIKIERFDVDIRRDSSGSQQNFTPQDRDQTQRQQSASGNPARGRRPSDTATLDGPQPVRRTISSTSINVVA